MIRIHNLETDEVIDREMNDIEFNQYQKGLEEVAEYEANAAAKAEAKAALLDKLGITAEEAQLLLS